MGWLDDLTSPDIFGESIGGNSVWDDYSPSPTVPSVTYDEPTDSGIGGLLGNILGGGSGDLGTTDVSFWDMMGDDWSYPVGSETGDPITAGDITYGDDWLSDFWGDMGDDWWAPVGSETEDPYSWLEEFDMSTIPEKKDPYSWLEEIDLSTLPDYKGEDYEPWSWLEEIDLSTLPEKRGDEDPEGPFGGKIGPWLRNLFLGSGEGGGGILGTLFGGGGEGGGGEGGGLGGLFGSNPLMAFLMAKSLMKDEQTPSSLVPIGQQAYGAPEAYNMPDYRVTNLEPALMPGVGYANMAQPQQPIGMEQGGLAGLMELMIPSANAEIVTGIGELPGRSPWYSIISDLGSKRYRLRQQIKEELDPISKKELQTEIDELTKRMKKFQDLENKYFSENPARAIERFQTGGLTSLEGPGDITLAKLEPGEFVIRREAVDKVGLPALERINNMGRGRSG